MMTSHDRNPPACTLRPRLLITAGPTREPIDSVRYIGNRSSGALGIALADTAATLGWPATLLLGPTDRTPDNPLVTVIRFERAADLRALLGVHAPECDILIMAAAVADFTPASVHAGKLLRVPDRPLVLELIPTADLLAEAAARAAPDQLLVGFALELPETLHKAAADKLERKRVDLIVANPLETMDSASIRAHLVAPPAFADLAGATPGTMPKREFAGWLLPRLLAALDRKRGAVNNP